MNDLEWLARHVHEWPKGIIEGVICTFTIGSREATGIARDHPEDWPYTSDFYSKDQWLAERARLQNKPGWDDHKWPSIFQSSDGNWFGVREGWLLRDHISDGWKGREVSLLREDGQFICHGVALMNWENSQEFRPEEQPMADKEWRGPEDGLPPVGTKCEVRTGYATEPYSYEECDIIAHFMGTSKMCAAYTTVNHDGSVMVGQGTIIAFRPLRTEEDKAVEDMYRDATGDELCGDEMDDQDIVSLCQVLFKAGYRKQDASE